MRIDVMIERETEDDIEEINVEFDVECTYRGRSAGHLCPPEPAEYEIVSKTYATTPPGIVLTAAELEWAQDKALELAYSDYEPRDFDERVYRWR